MSDAYTNPDYLKLLGTICAPDPRNETLVRFDANGPRHETIDDRHIDVAQFSLERSVPEQVRIQFETAKNLYLYAWFVYRFYPVAEHHALGCLELGLRVRFGSQLPSTYWNMPGREPTLRPLLRFAIESGAIKNEGFRIWRDRVQLRARERYAHEKRLEMVEQNLDQIEVNYDLAIPNARDRDWNYLPILLDALPGIRNCYAHGSTMLHDQVLATLELVCEIVNQAFDANGALTLE